jgi:hypothetical protein
MEMTNRSNACAAGVVITTWFTWIDLQFLENGYREVIAFYQEKGDVLIGQDVLDKYSVTFDGRNSRLTVL